MNKYMTIHMQDYIWYKSQPDIRLTQKSTCNRLSIPKYITKKYSKKLI